MLMPRRSHQTDNRLSPNKACGVENGTPLSVLIATGNPNSLKTRSNTGIAPVSFTDSSPSQASR